jgi:hypothetical protein
LTVLFHLHHGIKPCCIDVILYSQAGRITALQTKAPPSANSIDVYSSIRDTLACRAFLDRFIHRLWRTRSADRIPYQLYQSVLDAAVARHSRPEVKGLDPTLPCNSFSPHV